MKLLSSKVGQSGCRCQRSAATRGFTLIEAVVSMPIAAVVLVSLYACFSQGFAVVGQSREELRANQIMLTQIERIRLSPFDQLSNTNYNPQSLTNYFDPVDQSAGRGGVVYTVPDSGTLPEAYRTNMLQVTVGISWISQNVQHSRSMQTLVARYGIQSYVATGQ